ncbi:unnamed protein product [Symbiodinium natans]|uniref:Uncharacterized protein n=1 Tax=Symbiodinium natans TaxID=878477 RepID=A0A812NQ55_9DINO|nr:unnamed protein product [Symbiodinium natans]
MILKLCRLDLYQMHDGRNGHQLGELQDKIGMAAIISQSQLLDVDGYGVFICPEVGLLCIAIVTDVNVSSCYANAASCSPVCTCQLQKAPLLHRRLEKHG